LQFKIQFSKLFFLFFLFLLLFNFSNIFFLLQPDVSSIESLCLPALPCLLHAILEHLDDIEL